MYSTWILNCSNIAQFAKKKKKFNKQITEEYWNLYAIYNIHKMDKRLDSDFKRCMKFYLPPIIRTAQQIIKNSYKDNKNNVKKKEDLSCHF